MTFLKPLDVAIGLVFLFLLVTFLASALLEMISTIRNWRAEMLHGAISNMLRGSALATADQVYADPQIVALGRDAAAHSWVDLFEAFGWREPISNKPQPSYIPAATFSAAVLQLLAPGQLSPANTVAAIQSKLAPPPGPAPASAPADALHSVLATALATQGDSVQAIKLAIEKWFNDTMDRASGWYKRRTQAALLLIGLAIALGGNIDAVGVGLWLWKGDAARQAVVAAASDYAKGLPAAVVKASDGKSDTTAAIGQQLQQFGQQLIQTDTVLTSLQYPIGWPLAPGTFGLQWFLQYLMGCLIVAVAVSMGSSFWFDALQSLLKIRSAGPKPGGR
jgi:hypothetical protein